jgi:PadR family transcriptional regulator PadR
MNIENTQSQMRKGILEFCILSIIRRGEAYPSDIVEEMKTSGLHILEGNSGPPRKYFSLTPKGESFYKELEQTWQELANGVNALANKKSNEPLNQ